ncbi:hypothetical protein FHG87_008296 [Trinorchestia longiramus]|nr:hypothetical protein FHG87_008296 [Trinorchestia longiramus]
MGQKDKALDMTSHETRLIGTPMKESPDLEFSVSPDELALLDDDDCNDNKLTNRHSRCMDSMSSSPDPQEHSKSKDPSEPSPGAEDSLHSSITSKRTPIVFDLPSHAVENGDLPDSTAGEDLSLMPSEEVDFPKTSIPSETSVTSKAHEQVYKGIEVIQGRRNDGIAVCSSTSSTSCSDKLGAVKAVVSASEVQRPYVIRQNYSSLNFMPPGDPYSVQQSFQSPVGVYSSKYLPPRPPFPVYPNYSPFVPALAPQIAPFMPPPYRGSCASFPVVSAHPSSAYSSVPPIPTLHLPPPFPPVTHSSSVVPAPQVPVNFLHTTSLPPPPPNKPSLAMHVSPPSLVSSSTPLLTNVKNTTNNSTDATKSAPRGAMSKSEFPHVSSNLILIPTTNESNTHPNYNTSNGQAHSTASKSSAGIASSSSSAKAAEGLKFCISVEDVFRYMQALELKKILSIFGNVKQYKFVPGTSSTHASCEAQMQYGYQVLRAARILSLLTVEGVKMNATAATTNVTVDNTYSNTTMNMDVECMVTVGNFLKGTGHNFRWESSTSCENASSSVKCLADTPKLPAKIEAAAAPPCGNLIKIKLSFVDTATTSTTTSTCPATAILPQTNEVNPFTTATTSVSTSISFSISTRTSINITRSSTAATNSTAASETVPSQLKTSTSGTETSELKIASSPRGRPSHQDILKSVQTISQQMNDRQSRINKELEHVLQSEDLPDQGPQENSKNEPDATQQRLLVTIRWGTSKFASTTFTQIAELLRAHIVQRSGGCELLVEDLGIAEAVVVHLDGHRLLDAKLDAALSGRPEEGVDTTMKDVSHDRLLQEVDLELDTHNSNVQWELRRRADLALDVYTYKVDECTSQCSSRHCHDYHTDDDRRRDPRLVEYRPQYCKDGTGCLARELCPMAHTRHEEMAHPRVFRSSVCVTSCPASTDVCLLAHPCRAHVQATAEVLYHPSWKDLYVSGVRNTFSFFTGAIRSLYKKRQECTELSVLLITPHSRVAGAAVTVAAGVAERHKIKLATVCSGNEDISDCSAVAGTVKGLLKVLEQLKDGVPSLLALIVDDFSTIEKDADLLCIFTSLVAVLARPHEGLNSGVNKVVVSHRCLQDQVGVANSLLSTELKVLHYVPEIEQLTIAPAKIAKPVVLKSSDEESNISRSSSSEASNSEPRREKEQSMKKDNRSSVDAHDKSPEPSLKPKSQSFVSCKRKAEEKEMLSTDDRKLFYSSLPKRLRKVTTRILKRATSPGEEEEAGALTPEQFLVKERQLKLEVEEEYKVFQDMPEMHPEYEEILETFSTKYLRQPEGEDDDLWVRFWAEKMCFLQEQTWHERRNDLIEKYKHGSLQSKRSKFVSDDREYLPAEIEEKSVHKFCVRDALDALDSATDELGVLGPPLRRLIRCARDAGSSSCKAMQLFTSRDNAALLRMCIGKLSKMGLLAPKSKEILLLRTASLAEKLILHSEEYDKKYEMVRRKIMDLDVQSLAKSTEGLTPTEIIQVIRKTLGCENEDFLRKSELQEIYMSISAYHLETVLAEDDDPFFNSSVPRRIEVNSSENTSVREMDFSLELAKTKQHSPLEDCQEDHLKFRVGKASDPSFMSCSAKGNEDSELTLELNKFSPVPAFDVHCNSHEDLLRNSKNTFKNYDRQTHGELPKSQNYSSRGAQDKNLERRNDSSLSISSVKHNRKDESLMNPADKIMVNKRSDDQNFQYKNIRGLKPDSAFETRVDSEGIAVMQSSQIQTSRPFRREKIILQNQKSNDDARSKSYDCTISQSDPRTRPCRNLEMKSTDTRKRQSLDLFDSRGDHTDEYNSRRKGKLTFGDATKGSNFESGQFNHFSLKGVPNDLKGKLRCSEFNYECEERYNNIESLHQSNARRVFCDPLTGAYISSPSNEKSYDETRPLSSLRACNNGGTNAQSHHNLLSHIEQKRDQFSEEPSQCEELQRTIYNHYDHRPFHLMAQCSKEIDIHNDCSIGVEFEGSKLVTTHSKDNARRNAAKCEPISQVKVSARPSPEFLPIRSRESFSRYRSPSPQPPARILHSTSQALNSSTQTVSLPVDRLPSTPTTSLNHHSISSKSMFHTSSSHISSTRDKPMVSWFVSEVRQAMMQPNLTIKAFNSSLCDIFTRRPSAYVFSQQDRLLAEGLQELANFDLTETMLVHVLRKLLDDVS